MPQSIKVNELVMCFNTNGEQVIVHNKVESDKSRFCLTKQQ